MRYKGIYIYTWQYLKEKKYKKISVNVLFPKSMIYKSTRTLSTKSRNICLDQTQASASLQAVAKHATVSTGYRPTAVSEDSTSASTPSKTQFDISRSSARSGSFLYRMLLKSWAQTLIGTFACD